MDIAIELQPHRRISVLKYWLEINNKKMLNAATKAYAVCILHCVKVWDV